MPPPPLPKATGLALADVFAEIDREGNGYITFSNFVRWWKNKESEAGTKTLTDSCLMSAMSEFRKADKDNNGWIDAPMELYCLFTSLNLDEELFDGKLEAPEEAVAVPAPEPSTAPGGVDSEGWPVGVDGERLSGMQLRAWEKKNGPAPQPQDTTPPPPDIDDDIDVAPPPEPPQQPLRRLKVFYVQQKFLEDAPETVQLAVGNFSVMLMIHGETIATFPYLTLRNWGKNSTSFWMNAMDLDNNIEKWAVSTKQGKAISDLMVIQAQEMAKKMNPGKRNEGSVGWDDDVFQVDVYTGNVMGAGTDAQVFVELIGSTGSSGRLLLPAESNGRNNFERSQVDSFVIKLKMQNPGAAIPDHTPDFNSDTANYAFLPAGTQNVGKLKSLTVGHDGSGWGAGWHVAKIVVQNMRTFEKVEFMFDRWLDAKADKKSSGADRKIIVNCPGDSGEVVHDDGHADHKVTAIKKEKVVGTYRALSDVEMTGDAEPSAPQTGKLIQGDIVECFEEQTVQGKKRLRILSPALVMGWVTFEAGSKVTGMKTTTSWGSFRINEAGDGCSGWLLKKGGMRTNWTNRWFLLKGLTLTYFETNKLGVGKTEKGRIDLATVIQVCASKAPSATPYELEVVSNERTYRLRARNEPDYQQWLHHISRSAAV